MVDNDLSYHTFVPALLSEVPEFEPLYREHLEENSGEVIPHLLMADFSRFLRGAAQGVLQDAVDKDHWQGVINRSAALLDRALGSADARVQELVLSFLENFKATEPADRALKSIWGPNLQQAVTKYYSDWEW